MDMVITGCDFVVRLDEMGVWARSSHRIQRPRAAHDLSSRRKELFQQKQIDGRADPLVHSSVMWDSSFACRPLLPGPRGRLQKAVELRRRSRALVEDRHDFGGTVFDVLIGVLVVVQMIGPTTPS